MPAKHKRKSRRTLFWAWPAHLESANSPHILVMLWPKKAAHGQVRVRLTRAQLRTNLMKSKPHNPDRVRPSQIPKGWRLFTVAEMESTRLLRCRVREVSPKPNWGPEMALQYRLRRFTLIRPTRKR